MKWYEIDATLCNMKPCNNAKHQCRSRRIKRRCAIWCTRWQSILAWGWQITLLPEPIFYAWKGKRTLWWTTLVNSCKQHFLYKRLTGCEYNDSWVPLQIWQQNWLDCGTKLLNVPVAASDFDSFCQTSTDWTRFNASVFHFVRGLLPDAVLRWA